jgi:hypothetical protein
MCGLGVAVYVCWARVRKSRVRQCPSNVGRMRQDEAATGGDRLGSCRVVNQAFAEESSES